MGGVCLGTGDGLTFHAAGRVSIGLASSALAAGDLNGDGKPDLIAANSSSDTFSVSLWQTSQTVSIAGISVSGSGTHEVAAYFPGDAAYAATISSTIALTATPASPPKSTTTSLTPSTNTPYVGQLLSLDASVSTSSGTPAGSLTFFDGSHVLGVAFLDNFGVATLTTSSLTVGPHSLSAAYAGNAIYASSSSSAITVTVSGAADFTVTPGPATVALSAGQSRTVVVTITPVNGFVGVVSLP